MRRSIAMATGIWLAAVLALAGGRAEAQRVEECRAWLTPPSLADGSDALFEGVWRIEPGTVLAARIDDKGRVFDADVTFTPQAGDHGHDADMMMVAILIGETREGGFERHFAVMEPSQGYFATAGDPEGERINVFGGILRDKLTDETVEPLPWIPEEKCVALAGWSHLISEADARRRGLLVSDLSEEPRTPSGGPDFAEPSLSEMVARGVAGAEPEAMEGSDLRATFSRATGADADRSADPDGAADVQARADLRASFRSSERIDHVAAQELVDDATVTAATGERLVGPAETPSRLEICVPNERPYFVPAGRFGAGVTLAGTIRPSGSVAAFSMIADELFREPPLFAVRPESGNPLIRLSATMGFEFADVLGSPPIIPVILLEGGIVTPVSVDQPDAGAKARILVVGDPATVAISGLDALETELELRLGARHWEVDWLRIVEGGEAELVSEHDSLTDLVRGADPEKGPHFAESEDGFGRLTLEIERFLTTGSAVYDIVFWIIEGHRLPHTAPAQVDRMLASVAQHGNIARFPDGRPRKWLQILAGRSAFTYVHHYLEAPLKTGGAGYFTAESQNAVEGRRIILSDITVPFNAIIGIVGRVGGDVTTKADPGLPDEMESVLFDGAAILDRHGLVIDRETFEGFHRSALATLNAMAGEDAFSSENRDLTFLIGLRTDGDGAFNLPPLRRSTFERRSRLIEQRYGTDQARIVLESLERVSAALADPDPHCPFVFLPFDSRPDWNEGGVLGGAGEAVTDGEDASASGEPEAADPPPVDWTDIDPSDRKLLQAALKQAGFDPGPVDGRIGSKSKAAIRALQKESGWEESGELTEFQFEAITGRSLGAARRD